MTNASNDGHLFRPNSYIGRTVPRPNAKRLLNGRGNYTDDTKLPRMVHVAFLRSPHAHARINKIDKNQAIKAPGVVAVVDGHDIAEVCAPWVGVLAHLEGMKSAEQHALAIKKASWQGEPVAAVVASTRALAEDALELIKVEWEILPVVTDMEAA